MLKWAFMEDVNTKEKSYLGKSNLMENENQRKLYERRSEGLSIGIESQHGYTSFGVNQQRFQVLTKGEIGKAGYEYL